MNERTSESALNDVEVGDVGQKVGRSRSVGILGTIQTLTDS